MLDVLIAQRDCKHAGRSFAEEWVAENRGRIEAGIVHHVAQRTDDGRRHAESLRETLRKPSRW